MCAGKRKLQQHVDTACEKLQAARSNNADRGCAFGREAENVLVDRHIDANSVDTSGLPVGGTAGCAQQHLKIRFGLRQTQSGKKATVESHPIAATLSDVLQESKSTQSALNLHNSDITGPGVTPCPHSLALLYPDDHVNKLAFRKFRRPSMTVPEDWRSANFIKLYSSADPAKLR